MLVYTFSLVLILLISTAEVGWVYAQLGQQSGCLLERENAQAQAASIIGGFVPECDSNGDYKAKQCHYSAGQCWCAGSLGQRIPGTIGPSHEERFNHIDCVSERLRFDQSTIGGTLSGLDVSGIGATGAAGNVSLDEGGCPLAQASKPCNRNQDLCSSDRSCFNGGKCCFNGCFNECILTNGIKSNSIELGSSANQNAYLRRGQCPPASGFGSCLQACQSDNDCRIDFKCCYNGCGRECKPVADSGALNGQNPFGSVFGGSSLGRSPVECPPPSLLPGPCISTCIDEDRCRPDEKCCTTSCGGRTCVRPSQNGGIGPFAAAGPLRPGPGNPFDPFPNPEGCPRTSGPGGPCINQCLSDLECGPNQRCCSNGCGRICTPVFGSGGFGGGFGGGAGGSFGGRPEGNFDGGFGNGFNRGAEAGIIRGRGGFGGMNGDPCINNPCTPSQICVPRAPSSCLFPPCAPFECRGDSSSATGVSGGHCSDLNAQFVECGGQGDCQETCFQPGSICTECVPGCVCKPGYVRRSRISELCIEKSQCRLYAEAGRGGPGFGSGISGSGNGLLDNVAGGTRGLGSNSSGGNIVTQAVATFSSGTVQGRLLFSQLNAIGPVTISGTIQGLTPGKHGLHVHESADIQTGCSGAGAHFNPTGQRHGSPKDLVRHVGDLGNIVADAVSNVQVEISDVQISLNGPNNVVGRAVVVHEREDDLGQASNDESKRNGNTGAPIACAIIGVKSTTQQQQPFVVTEAKAKTA